MARLTRCGNCNELPTIKEQQGYYRFRLDHHCHPTFSLESHQHTADACRRDWTLKQLTRKSPKCAYFNEWDARAVVEYIDALASQPKDGELLALADAIDPATGTMSCAEAAKRLRTIASRRVEVTDDYKYGINFILRHKDAVLARCAGSTELFVVERTFAALQPSGEVPEMCCEVCHEPMAGECACQNEYAREHDSHAER